MLTFRAPHAWGQAGAQDAADERSAHSVEGPLRIAAVVPDKDHVVRVMRSSATFLILKQPMYSAMSKRDESEELNNIFELVNSSAPPRKQTLGAFLVSVQPLCPAAC